MCNWPRLGGVYRQKRQTSSHETVTSEPPVSTVMSPAVFDDEGGYDELIDLDQNDTYDHPHIIADQPAVPSVYQSLNKTSTTNA